MRLQTPSFWQEKGVIAYALWPLSLVYLLVSLLLKTRRTKVPYKGRLPLICIGNVVMGGSGKTPTAIALFQLLKARGYQPAFISRGYGGALSKKQALQVNPQQHCAHRVGDEALLLAQYAPVFIAARRVQAVKLAQQQPKIDVLIMDDGLQNDTVEKTISLMVTHGGYGIGNGFLFPAGPLREPLSMAKKKVQALWLIDGKEQEIPIDIAPVYHASLQTVEGKTPPKEKRYIAFAGIAHPLRFFSFLKEKNYALEKTVAFADHYPYTPRDILQLQALAKQYDAILITTQKDWVRLPKDIQEEVAFLPVSLKVEEPEKLIAWLDERLHKREML